MSTDTRTPAAPESDAGLPDAYRPLRRFPRWAVVLTAVLLILGTAMTIAWPINLPYYAYAPGPVYDAGDFVSIPEGESFESVGDLFFLTVSGDEANLMEVIGAFLDKRVELRPRENVVPQGVTREQVRRRTLRSMAESQMFAKFVALDRLGYQAELIEAGAMVVTVMEGTPADGVLEVEDVFASVDGTPIESVVDLSTALSGKAPGETVELRMLRFDDSGVEQELTFEIVLGTHPEDPARGFIGIGLDFVEWDGDFEIDVEIDSRNIGGPSAGMMFTLQIINLLTPDDLTKGHRIAGTGTIQQDGTVGPIGGVQQKVYGAISVGADYMLVPAGDNYEDALGPAADDIELVPIGDIDDALTFFESLAPTGQYQAQE
jgi:PDZ domain-containing protein